MTSTPTLRLFAALVAFGAGSVALVIAILVMKSALG